MIIAQHAPGFDRPWENGAHTEFGSDIGFGWPCFSNRRSGSAESCNRPVNSVELIRQFLTFLFKHAAYPIHFDHCHPDGSSLLSRARTSPIPRSPILAVTAYGPRVVPGVRGMISSRAPAR